MHFLLTLNIETESQRAMAHYGIESLTLKEVVPGTFVLPFWTRFRQSTTACFYPLKLTVAAVKHISCDF